MLTLTRHRFVFQGQWHACEQPHLLTPRGPKNRCRRALGTPQGCYNDGGVQRQPHIIYDIIYRLSYQPLQLQLETPGRQSGTDGYATGEPLLSRTKQPDRVTAPDWDCRCR